MYYYCINGADKEVERDKIWINNVMSCVIFIDHRFCYLLVQFIIIDNNYLDWKEKSWKMYRRRNDDLPLLFRLKLDDDDDNLGINGAKYDNLFTYKFINRVVSRQRWIFG